MDIEKAVEALKKEADKNPAFKDVLKMWSSRERTRGQVTVRALDLRMRENGKDHDKAEYGKLLKLMGNLGLGQVKYDKTGDVVGLFGVQTTLQSLGQAALGKGKSLKAFAQYRNYRYQSVEKLAEKAAAPIPTALAAAPSGADRITSISVPIGGQMVAVPVPEGLTDEQLGAFIKRLLGK